MGNNAKSPENCPECMKNKQKSCSMCEFAHDKGYCEEACNYDHIRYEPMFKRCPECGKEWED